MLPPWFSLQGAFAREWSEVVSGPEPRQPQNRSRGMESGAAQITDFKGARNGSESPWWVLGTVGHQFRIPGF